jgi:hypothetical protein
MPNNQSQQAKAVASGSQDQAMLPIVNDGFVNLITGIPSSGQVAKTFICSNMDALGNTNTYYMKVYADNKYVINEMVGYLLAKERGLDVASKAYILRIGDVTRAIIDGFYESHGKENSLEHHNTEFAFIISSAPGITISTYHSDTVKQTDFFKRKIKAWKKNNTLIAFDEWIANTDRNAGNIIFGENVNYIIDHGSAPVTMNWTVESLIASECYKNVHLLNTIFVLNKKPKDEDLLAESNRHNAVFSGAKTLISDLISSTVSMTNDYNAMLGFLEARSVNARTAPFENMSGAR